MRDEGAQARGELGTPVRHAALIGFINRNYECDESGQWFFQNGPQRVYVELAYTPWVVRLARGSTDGDSSAVPSLTLTDQTGAIFEPVEVLIDDQGAVLFVDALEPARVALLHDHDLDLFSNFFVLDDEGRCGRFNWRAEHTLPANAIEREQVAERFSFVASPASAAARRG